MPSSWGRARPTARSTCASWRRYGLVEEAPSSSRRERPWQLTTTDQSWSTVQPDETSTRAAAELERVFVEHEMAKLMRWEHTAASYPANWRAAALRSAAQTWLTADELADLGRRVTELLVTYRDRLSDPAKRPPGSRPVRLLAVGYPLPDDRA